MKLSEKFCIVSGGQTGADRAALDFAIRAEIAHGGWCPQGRLAEDGPLPTIYQLHETTSRRYDQRTRWNVRDSDATLLLTIAPKLRGGTGLTAKVAERLGKPYLHICLESKDSLDEAVIRLLEFISRHDVSRLNVAGPRASQEPEIGPFVDAILSSALLNNASISTDPTTHRL